MHVPFNIPSFEKKSIIYLNECLASNKYSGNGSFSKKSEYLLEKIHGTGNAFLTQSCTQALEMALSLLQISKGDEVIVPSFNFTSAAIAVMSKGAQPVFVDIRIDTKNIDENQIESAISDKTKAIIVMHYAGIACEMNKIMDIAKRNNIFVIEDNAHGLGANYEGKVLGTFGDFSVMSFHETKNIQCGEGGALLINNKKYTELAEIYREKGTNRTDFFRGKISKYEWIEKGSSTVQSEILSSLLLGQLENLNSINNHRIDIWNTFFEKLIEWAKSKNFSLPVVPNKSNHVGHIFYLMAPTNSVRQKFIQYLKNNNIDATIHYQSLHKSPAAKKYGLNSVDLPISSLVSDNLVRIPMYNSISRVQIEYLIKCVMEF